MVGTSPKLRGAAAETHRRRVASTKPNLRIRPDLAAAVQRSGRELGIPLSTLVGYLVRNDAITPAVLAEVLAQARLSRSLLACTLTASTGRLAARGARRCKLSRNAYLEALIAAHLADPGPLVVLRAKSSARL
ncbi:MAG: hypothetical protein IPL39_14535 [Opitutaceae bacterium]|nr:hypothetical protein [Opitutaceae bacterium]